MAQASHTELTLCLLTFDSFYYSDVEDSKNDEVMPGCFESTKEAGLLTILGAFGQSWDVYSDIALAVQFANGKFTQSHFLGIKRFCLS